MIHHPKAMRALFVAVLLSMIPATTFAADATSLVAKPAATPLNTNLLTNASFEKVDTAGALTTWTTSGLKAEKFGTRSWPSKAYGNSYNGGKRYLTCWGGAGGSVTQTVNFDDGGAAPYALTARMTVNFGGKVGHQLRVTILATGGAANISHDKLKVLDVSNHYKKGEVTLRLPQGTTHLQATIELIRKDGAGKCKVAADTADLWVYQA